MAKRTGTRIQIEPGDSPWSIAAALVGDGARFPELVAANPQKVTTALGTFATLIPGEVLYVPLSWIPAEPEPPHAPEALGVAHDAAGLDDADDAGALSANDVTPRIFARALLYALDLPTTPNNIAAVIAWQAFEGGHWRNAAAYNPLNTTRQHGDSRAWGGKIPIQVFTTWDEGLEATALTLAQQNMTSIRVRLGMDADPVTTLQAIKDNPHWGTFNLDPQAWRAAQAYGDTKKSTNPMVAALTFAPAAPGLTPGLKVPHGPTPTAPPGARGFADLAPLVGVAAIGLGAFLAMKGGAMKVPGYAVIAGGALMFAGGSKRASAAPAPAVALGAPAPAPALHGETKAAAPSGPEVLSGQATISGLDAGDLTSEVLSQAKEYAHVEATRAAERAKGYAMMAAGAGAVLGALAGKVL